MPAAVAIPSAVSAGSSIFSGILGSTAANRAASQQAASSRQAQQGLQDTLGFWNPQIGQAGTQAASDVNGDTVPAGFTRINAYRSGLTGSADRCFSQYR